MSAPDDRNIDDISAIDECASCGWEPAAIVLVDGDWECYNCGQDFRDDVRVMTDGGVDETGTERSRLMRRLIETAAHGARGQLNEDEEHAETRCRYCGESHLGELYESPPEGFYVRYYCPNTDSKGRRSFP